MKMGVFRRITSVVMTGVLIASSLTIIPSNAQAKAKKPKLAKSSLTLKQKATTKVKIKNVKKKQIKKLTVKSNSTSIATVKKSGTTAIKISGKKIGTAKITATLKLKKKIAGKKKYTLKLTSKVTMRALKGKSIDFSKSDNWINFPTSADKDVDTIWIYPTVILTPDKPAIVPADDKDMKSMARQMYAEQGSVFEKSTNVYAPVYRQSNLSYLSGKTPEQFEEYQYQEQRTDIYGALDYYFKNLNKGKPFILAGHSQGSMMVRMILKDYMAVHPEYLKKMVAAYVLGYSITKKDLNTKNISNKTYLNFAKKADDTGVIVSWNAEGPDNKTQDNVVVLDGAISINPLNWKRDDTYAGVEQNLGSECDFVAAGADSVPGKIKKGVADARIDADRGVVIIESTTDYIKPELAGNFGTASFHGKGEYDFFYNNIRQNVQTRISAWKSKTNAFKSAPTVTASDYSKEDNWLNIPKTLTSPVDTFYIYPTAYMDSSADAPIYCEIDNAGMRTTAKNNFDTNAPVYADSTNVFAPYYRQTSITALQDSPGPEAEKIASDKPRADIYAALDYYFENYNNGRPFILAGHSQGSMLIRIVLKEYMNEHPEYYERMVAAYPIGYSITDDDLSTKNSAGETYLKFASGETDTGSIISWNTEGPDNKDSFLVLDGAHSINPINWRIDATKADASENLGTRLGDGSIQSPGVASARIDTTRGVVVVDEGDELNAAGTWTYLSTVEKLQTKRDVFGAKSFHGYDYSFYYENIKENVGKRVASYQGIE